MSNTVTSNQVTQAAVCVGGAETSKGCDCRNIDLKKKYSVVVTTSTNLRKVGQTAAIKMLSSRQTNLITRHVLTAARCYQVMLGKKEVARAHALCTHLHEGKENGEIPLGDEKEDEDLVDQYGKEEMRWRMTRTRWRKR